jgi:hypothetical protein
VTRQRARVGEPTSLRLQISDDWGGMVGECAFRKW